MHYLKYTLALLAVLSFAQARACERSLEGSWKSDGAASMEFVRDKAKLPQNTTDFLQSILGKMSLAFSGNDVHIVMPDADVPGVAGKPLKFTGIDETKPYRVLFCSRAAIVWSTKRSFADGDEANTWHFVDADTIWVYGGSTVPGIPDLHIREYFRRTR